MGTAAKGILFLPLVQRVADIFKGLFFNILENNLEHRFLLEQFGFDLPI